MKIAILQPTYLPWLGYFSLIKSVKKLIFLDDVQFDRRSWQQRNIIADKTKQNIYLTIPVKKKGNYLSKINFMEINYQEKWVKKHLLTIQHCYSKYKYFNEINNSINEIINRKYKYLSELNIDLILYIIEYLEIDIEINLSSKLNVSGKKDEKLLNIVKKVGGDHYISPAGSKNYLENENLIKENNINFSYMGYTDHYKNNNQSLSIIHFLFKHGKKTIKLI